MPILDCFGASRLAVTARRTESKAMTHERPTLTPSTNLAGSFSPQPCDFIWAATDSEQLPPAGPAGDRFRRPLQCRQILAAQRADRPQGAGADLKYAGADAGAELLRSRHATAAAAGRYAGLRPCRGLEGQDRRLDAADARLSARPRRPEACLRLDRRRATVSSRSMPKCSICSTGPPSPIRRF